MKEQVGGQFPEGLIEELRRDRESLWRILFEQSNDGVVVLNVDGGVFAANQKFVRMLGYSGEDVSRMYVWDWEALSSKAEILEMLDDINDSGERFETCHRRKDGGFIDVELSNSATMYKGQKLIFCICRDITERKLLEEEIYRYATTDTLTGLYNRRTFGERLKEEMDRASRHGTPLSLIMYDFDAFKAINDELGHAVGDEVLQQSAALVRQNVRSTDMVVRWGGEEFMILVRQTNLAQAEVLAEKLRQVIEAYAFSSELKVTASFGVTGFFPGESENKLLKRVDDALYRAKGEGRNRVVVARVPNSYKSSTSESTTASAPRLSIGAPKL